MLNFFVYPLAMLVPVFVFVALMFFMQVRWVLQLSALGMQMTYTKACE